MFGPFTNVMVTFIMCYLVTGRYRVWPGVTWLRHICAKVSYIMAYQSLRSLAFYRIRSNHLYSDTIMAHFGIQENV